MPKAPFPGLFHIGRSPNLAMLLQLAGWLMALVMVLRLLESALRRICNILRLAHDIYNVVRAMVRGRSPRARGVVRPKRTRAPRRTRT